MAKPRYIVWIKEDGKWAENGDGPMGEKTARRVAGEIAKAFKLKTKALPAGQEPL